MSEQMWCSVCKKDVDEEVSEDGSMSYCPICHTGYHNISYEAHMRELEDEHAILSEFENETSPKIVRQLTKDAADLAIRGANDEDFLNEKMCATCGHSESRHKTAGGFCKHCPCIEFVDHTTSAKPLI